jgi:hypothetical protein
MIMATTLEYALLAGASYFDTRSITNRLPLPSSWEMASRVPEDGATGFEASTYINSSTNEIVISYAGTYPGTIVDIAADAALAEGYTATQLLQAAQYYLKIKNNPRYQGCNITLTGHSLGGGLASLVGVFFHVPTTTFDQAPFANSAQSNSLLSNPLNLLTQDVAAMLKDFLLTSAGYTEQDIAPLTNYLLMRTIDGSIPNSSLITNIRVDGEFLSAWFGFNSFNTIGNTVDVIGHGQTDVSGVALHAQALLIAFLQSRQTATSGKALNDVTNKLTDLLAMVFDENLFAHGTDPTSDKVNLLEHLVRHQAGGVDGVPAGGDAMVTRFTTDLWKLAQDGGMTMNEGAWNWKDVNKALIAFAMEKYYNENDPNVCYGTELFTDLSQSGTGNNGIQFDTATVVGAGKSITTAKGYEQYFRFYLGTTSSLTTQERGIIDTLLPKLRDWYVQAGASGMNATDTLNQGAFMLGGKQADTLTGGARDDLLLGNAGDDNLTGGEGQDTLIGGANSDTLTGGGGKDQLIGGTGKDTYYVGAGDTVIDSDGNGVINLNGVNLTGGKRKKGSLTYVDDNGNSYLLQGNKLLINGVVTIDNFKSGQLGIQLTEQRIKQKRMWVGGDGDYLIDYNIGEEIGENYRLEVVLETADPLVLDLNGDGYINTVGLDAGILFDQNGSGAKQSTAWIAPSDGFLVLDRNGNGVIDNGTELFGNNTSLYDSTGQMSGQALDGFAALAQEDTNHDGVVNNQDSNFAQLKVWRDLNQDGISQTDELTLLSDNGITSLNINKTSGAFMLLNDNSASAVGQYTFANGTMGQMFDVNLVSDSFVRSFVDSVPIADTTQALPSLQGAGAVRDLLEAASMQTAEGRALLNRLTMFASNTSGLEQHTLMDSLLQDWTATSTQLTSLQLAARQGITLHYLDANGIEVSSAQTQHINQMIDVLECFGGMNLVTPWGVLAAGTTRVDVTLTA